MNNLFKALVSSGQAADLEEAKIIVAEMKLRVEEGENPEEVLYEHGLEPDYVFEIIGW